MIDEWEGELSQGRFYFYIYFLWLSRARLHTGCYTRSGFGIYTMGMNSGLIPSERISKSISDHVITLLPDTILRAILT